MLMFNRRKTNIFELEIVQNNKEIHDRKRENISKQLSRENIFLNIWIDSQTQSY